MDQTFGLYPQFYVKRKSILFPIIEKYTNISLKGKTHGEVILVYFRLLKTNEQFKTEVDSYIDKENFKGAAGYRNGAGIAKIVEEALNVVQNVFGYAEAAKIAKSEEDQAFMEIVLNEQKKDDTMRILVISGITLAFLGLGTFLILKYKKIV